MIYKYHNIVMPGPDGTVLSFRNNGNIEDAGNNGIVELAELDGWRYVFVPDDAEIPEQYAEIEWQLVTLSDAEKEAIKAVSQSFQWISEKIQQRLDGFAATRGYDNILSACTYATSSNAIFAAEGQYCVAVRDETWSAFYTVIDAALAGTRPMPASVADIESDLPALAWPEEAAS
jgi:hypothetical protein